MVAIIHIREAVRGARQTCAWFVGSQGVINHTLHRAHLFGSLKELTRFSGKRGFQESRATSGEGIWWAKSRFPPLFILQRGDKFF